MSFIQGQPVIDAITETPGIVNVDEGGSTVNVSWEPNENGGYINDHPRALVLPAS